MSFSKFGIPEGSDIADFSLLVLVSPSVDIGTSWPIQLHVMAIPIRPILSASPNSPVNLGRIAYNDFDNSYYISIYAAQDGGAPCVGTSYMDGPTEALDSIVAACLIR